MTSSSEATQDPGPILVYLYPWCSLLLMVAAVPIVWSDTCRAMERCVLVARGRGSSPLEIIQRRLDFSLFFQKKHMSHRTHIRKAECETKGEGIEINWLPGFQEFNMLNFSSSRFNPSCLHKLILCFCAQRYLAAFSPVPRC